jgi:hypothetical protein
LRRHDSAGRLPLAAAYHAAMCQIIATAWVLTLYLFAAALDERPEMMLVGLAPLSLVAAETVWHLLGDFVSEKT